MTNTTTQTGFSINDASRCFYNPVTASVIDICRPDGTGYWGTTLETARAEYSPEVIECCVDWAHEQSENACKKPVREITEERFDDALNCLPPASWVRSVGVQSFHMCEMWSGSISDIFVKIGGRFFCLRDTIRLTHAERVQRCADFISRNN